MSERVRPDSPLTGRNLDLVLGFHNLNVEQLLGKTVLDLGCGTSDLQSELDECGPGSLVIGLDAAEEQVLRPSKTHKILADIGVELPIATQSVDVVLATWSFPMWAQSKGQVATFFRESKRVIKPKGLLSIYPFLVAEPISSAQSPDKNMVHQMRRLANAEAGKIKRSPFWKTTQFKDSLLQASKRL